MACIVLGLAAASTSGCKPSVHRVAIGRIVIDAPRVFDRQDALREPLRQALIRRLERDGSVVVTHDSPAATHVLQIVLTASAAATPQAPLASNLEVRLRPSGDGPEMSSSAAVSEGADALAALVTAFDAAWARLRVLRELDVADDAKLLLALRDTDASTREFAIERVGERRLASAVDPLCASLREESEPSLVLKSIGALVAIGDRRAVAPLIELSHQKDPGFVLQVAFAVSALGGRTAEAYLVTLAGGHPDEEVRRGAKDALDELTRRAAARRRERAP